ncbi:MAG: type II toxin-antitoxin system VapC family toxin [Planctomycetaceae bacterium]
MRILLDTHAFLWFFTNDPSLSLPALSQISDRNNDVLISPASYWEVAIKVSLGKYPLSVSFEHFWTAGIIENDFRILPITIAHASLLASLPMHHKDPFDRMIIAQAIAEQVPVVGVDSAFDAYGVTRLW